MDVDQKNGKLEEEDGEDEQDRLMRKLMGFTSFKSTQNTKVPGNNISGVRKDKKVEYRQYAFLLIFELLSKYADPSKQIHEPTRRLQPVRWPLPNVLCHLLTTIRPLSPTR